VKGTGPQREINPPGNWIAPPGSNRSGGGGNKAAGAIAGHHAETRVRPLAHDKERYSHSRVKYVDQEVLIVNKVDVAIIRE
jgi:hypothetical protein